MKSIFQNYTTAAMSGLFSWSLAFPMSGHAEFMEGDAALSSVVPNIPEPLLFDLVRPLGAIKGEMEVNALAQPSLEGGTLQWAPEIEYVFADGYAFELELPSENSNLAHYKLTLQGTFNNPPVTNMIHGWQLISKKSRDTGKYAADALYINGYRFSKAWSTLNMLGIKRTEFNSGGETITLINNSLFYDYSQRLTYGIELNQKINQKGQWRYSMTPQVHLDLSRNITMQTGISISRLNEGKKMEKKLAMRLIFAF